MPRLFGRSTTPAPEMRAPTPPRAKLVRRTGEHGMALPSSASASFSGSSAWPGLGVLSPPPRREGSLASASASIYETLLNGPDRSSLYGSSMNGDAESQHGQQRQHAHGQPDHSDQSGQPGQPGQPRYYSVRSQRGLHRAWLSAADARRPSWSGERPPPRKLVKDPNGSARPSAAREIHDSNDLRRKTVHRATDSSTSSGGPGTLGIRKKMARWRDLHW